jgi:hypothetical protein
MREQPRSNVTNDDRLLEGTDLENDKLTGTPKGKPNNPDPITGAPGSHPVGTGVGAAGGGLAGAAIGAAVGGPIGGVVGGAVGAVSGGLAGKGVAERIDPTVEDKYWRDNYRTRPYVGADETYETYGPAYRYGWESRQKYQGKSWDEAEPELGRNWNSVRGTSSLQWERAKGATKDAWHRVERALPGDADQDGR